MQDSAGRGGTVTARKHVQQTRSEMHAIKHNCKNWRAGICARRSGAAPQQHGTAIPEEGARAQQQFSLHDRCDGKAESLAWASEASACSGKQQVERSFGSLWHLV